MPRPPKAEISLRYLQDQSEASFQIPNSTQWGSNLMADDSGDFAMDDADYSLSTPLPSFVERPRVAEAHLSRDATASPPQSLPARVASKVPIMDAPLSSPNTSPFSPVRARPPTQRPLSSGVHDDARHDMFTRKKRDSYLQKGIDLSEHSTRRFRRDPQAHVGKEVETGFENEDAKEDTPMEVARESGERPVLKHPQKDRPRPRKSTTTRKPSLPSIDHPTSEIQSVANGRGEADTSISSISSGVAERLVHYSQRLMNTIGLLGASPRTAATHKDATAPSSEGVVVDGDHEASEPAIPLDESNALAANSQRPSDSRKRSRSPAPESSHAVKKSRLTVPKLETTGQPVITGRSRSGVPAAKKLASKSAVLQRQDRGIRTISKKGSGSASVEGSMNARGILRPKPQQLTNRAAHQVKSRPEREGESKTMARSVPSRMPHTIQPSQTIVSFTKSTIPKEFNFVSDGRVRVDTCRTEFQEKLSTWQQRSKGNVTGSAASIPDFKLRKAAQQAMFVADAEARRERIKPVVPLPLNLSTAARAKEREKFDAERRRKDLEIERQNAERIRLQADVEELEVRELRQKAVPKANEVPAWYAAAPRRNDASLRR